ncbi:MAG: hypothetical protein CVU71_13540 [Deltaproteobacteria bacterium HGW-Deltaproteobacteria-6]|jgi:hypothetical protein|nr:MAG: hypothetical protein CVU71_13540 [Deltaproteobacteria bacterium HGW-Deltaproteobacteria-6]
MSNKKIKYLKYAYGLVLGIFFLFAAVFIINMTLNLIRMHCTSPAGKKINDIVISKDGFEFRVVPPEYYNIHSAEPADILLYGDSWTFGFGVAHGYAFSELIRDHFGNRYSVKIAGKNGSDLARQYIAIKNTPFKPRLSIIFFNLGNDYEGSMMQSQYWSTDEYVTFGDADGSIVIKPRDDSLKNVFKYAPDFAYMNKFVVSKDLIRDRLNNIAFKLGLKEEFLNYTYYLKQHFYSINGGWKYVMKHKDPQIERCANNGYKLIDALFNDMKSKLDGKLIVVLLEPREFYGMDIYRRMYVVAAAERGIDYNNLDFNKPRKNVISILQRHGIKYIDVYPTMEKAILDGKNVFINNNDHPNWLGHRVIYSAVIAEIEKFIGRDR